MFLYLKATPSRNVTELNNVFWMSLQSQWKATRAEMNATTYKRKKKKKKIANTSFYCYSTSGVVTFRNELGLNSSVSFTLSN